MSESGTRTSRRNEEMYYSTKRNRDTDRDRERDRDRDGLLDFDRASKRGSNSSYRDYAERPSREGRGYRVEAHMGRRRDANLPVVGVLSNDDRRGGSERFGDRRDGWSCTECHVWNDARCNSCERCDLPQKPRYHAEARSRDEEEVDEFGRKKGSSVKPSGPRWPPPFDRRSSTYVFDTRSGMFYHASSQFFFDPKTKLYYGNKEQTYYVHCKGEHPPFKEFKPETTDAPKVDQESKVEPKKVIAISLKTKVLGGSDKPKETSKKETAPTAPIVSREKKKYASNIDRWSERGREIAGKGPVVRTKSGQPVCLVCKRKFADLQKLERHEDISELHKANAANCGKRMKLIEGTESEAYARDRAMERRVLHCADAELPFGRLLPAVDTTMASVAVDPKRTLDKSNVGNQMLTKLGWKSGMNLGRNAGTESSESALQKDWERIEQLAKHGNMPS